MSMPPYLLGPNPWAQMMAQQQLAVAHVAAAQAHAHALQQQMPPPHPKSDVMTEDKLQEKGTDLYLNFFYITLMITLRSSKVASASVKALRGEAKIRFCRSPKGRYASRAYPKNY